MAIAIVGSATGTNFSGTASPVANLPAGIASGHVMIAVITIGDDSIALNSITGWTQIGTTQNTGDSSNSLLLRVCDGTEGATWTFTNLFAAGRSGQIVISAWSGVNNTTPVHKVAQTTTSGSGTITAPSITPTVGGCMILHLLGCDPANNSYETTPDTSPAATQEYDASAGGNTAAYSFIQSYLQTTAAAITLDAGGAETDDWANFQIALAPAAAAAVTGVATKVYHYKQLGVM